MRKLAIALALAGLLLLVGAGELLAMQGQISLTTLNNTFSTAQSLTMGTFSLNASDDAWFKIDLGPGAFYAEMTPATAVDLNMVIYNANQQVVASNFAAGKESVEYHVSTGGTYYIEVYKTSSSSTDYTLYLSDIINKPGDDIYDTTGQGNDTLARAVDLGSLPVRLTNLMALDDDWFKFRVSPGILSVKVTPGPLVEVYNGSGVRIADSINAGGTSFDVPVTASDTYYIGISGGNGITYDLSLSSGTNWAKVLDYGPIRDASIGLFDIDKDGKDEIFVATSKGLDAGLNEIRPAGLICLKDDGSIKWATSFPAMATADPQTGKLYKTTSVSTAPAFADLDGDGNIDIVVGVGGDTFGEAGAGVVGQPGDKGGVYALNSDGSIKWFHPSLDVIGGSNNVGDGRPDGVYGSPVIFDIDGDGIKEVIYNSWDQRMWILDGRTGVPKLSVNLADTIWSTPKIADINEDGKFEILVSADITANTNAGTTTGGIFHVISAGGEQNIAGFSTPVGNANYTTLRGKVEEQALWSSPVTGDLDGDGHLEIAYGTGNYFQDNRGQYIRVWNHDGTQRFQLSTVGRTFATPLICDLNGDGQKEIVATTLDGYVFAWDHLGNQLFATQTTTYGSSGINPIFSSPIAVDINGDGKLEIIYAQGAQMVIVDHLGHQLSNPNAREMIFEQYKGSPAVHDINGDGQLEIVSGGTTPSKDQAEVYCWNFSNNAPSVPFLNGRYQFNQSTSNIDDFVSRFYETVLGRKAEAAGRIYWVDSLSTGILAGADVARGFIFSQEFTNRALSDSDYVDVLYRAFFNRAPDQAGYSDWMGRLQQGGDRAAVLDGFIFSQEFRNLCANYSILPVK